MVVMLFPSFKNCVKNPHQVVRLVVVIVCVVVSCYQLAQCVSKLRNPPISVRYWFKLNESLRYPAITVCRNPPYKYSVFKEFGLKHTEIYYSRTWSSFNYENYTLKDFFERATYNLQEIIPVAAFDQYRENLTFEEIFTLRFGRCFRFKAKELSNAWGFGYGYFFYFSLSSEVTNLEVNSASSPLGVDIYVHDDKEVFTEKLDQADRFMEYFYLEAGDALQVNLKVKQLQQLPTRRNHCIPQENYSGTKCLETCLNERITKEVSCSTPWLPNFDLPDCRGNQTVQAVELSAPKSEWLTEYINFCKCPMQCLSTQYRPYVQSRKDLMAGSTDSTLGIYFTSNLVTSIEEISTYDWNVFLADLGGSLGFLLGLSVLGVVGILERMLSLIFKQSKISRNGNDDSKENKSFASGENTKY